MLEKLLLCPFCGGEAKLMEIEPHTHIYAIHMPECEGEAFIECTKCTATMSGRTVQEVTAAWNRRVEAKTAGSTARNGQEEWKTNTLDGLCDAL